MFFGRLRKGFIINALLILISISASAQQGQLKFKHISFREGLAQSPISCIFQDSQGFIWIGNWKGLTRYDGNEFRTFKHDDTDSTSLSNNRVNAIVEDAENNMWIATANGISCYNPKIEKFRSILSINVKGGKNYISSVLADQQKKIWVATFSGVKLVKDHQLQDIPGFKRRSDSSLYNGVTFTIFRDSGNRIWTGTKRGPACFDPVSRRIIELPPVIKSNAGLMAAKILVIRQDRQGDIWFGTESSGVFRYSARQNRCYQYRHSEATASSLCSDWIKDILISRDGKVWIGTRGGISLLQDDGSFLNYEHRAEDPDSMNDSTVWSLMQDSSLNIWIGTFAGGINLLYQAGNNFTNIGERIGSKQGLNHPVVNAVAEDPDGSLWIGTYGGGINHVNLKTGAFQYYSVRPDGMDRPTNGVKSLFQDDKDNLWIGTLDGLYRFNKRTHAIKNFSFPVNEGKLSENLINTILVDGGGVWAGTNGGGLRYINEAGKITTFRHDEKDPVSLSDNFVTCIRKDDRGNMWISTQNGLNYFDVQKQKFTAKFRRSKKNSISNNTVLTLLIDSKKRLWLGTEGGGLNCYDRNGKRFYTVRFADGLSDNVIQSIQEDRSGNIWVSTDNGIFKVHTAGLRFPFKPSLLKVTYYNSNDGLGSNQFSTNAGLRTSKGLLVFGGVNGLTLFSPEAIVKNRFIPKVVITGLFVRNNRAVIGEEGSPLKQAINYTREITLNYDQRFISVKFAALNFINPANNQYAYKLEGLTNKEDWHYAGNQSAATYTNLGPGDYTFVVKAANNDGLWNNVPATLKITVLPPWWMTWWAYLLYVLTIGSIVFATIRFFRIRAKLKRDLFYEQLQNERQQELYQMKLNFFTNISHEIRTPLTLIVGPLEKLISSALDNAVVHKQLILVKNNADRLMRLVTELLDFRKVETGHMKLHFYECNIVKFTNEIFLSFQNIALSRNIEYTYHADSPDQLVCFDKDQMEKVFFNLLSNAFKFTPDNGQITLSVKTLNKKGNEWVDIIIRDNGKGIPEESQKLLFNNFFQADQSKSHLGTGIGLALSKSIVELHKGELNVYSVPATEEIAGETTFTVSLRTGRSHLGDEEIQPDYMNSEDTSIYRIQQEKETLGVSEKGVSADKKYSVLVIEDNAEVRSFISGSLSDYYYVHESPDGLKGLADTFSLMPDLVISDVMMPGMDGLEVCRNIKSDERTNHIPVILLTARATFIHQVNGLENGADAYITKPFSIQLLELQIHNILEAKEVIRKKYSREVILQPKNIAITSPEEKFLHKLMEIVERNIDNDQFGVQELVEEIGMSKTVLYKKVQSLTDLSVADYIKSVRLQKAAMMLSQNKTGIAEVAFAVGFNDRKYFSKEFRKQYGLSPTEYINQNSPAPVGQTNA
ncbi:signal transduction histidine kinase [Arcticibacter tournemirensis]|uniref:histidine kinase n=1 Tax=Arcticibacter tournemirensis TaxID=699437 RepID=A0A5M9HCW0_9SPHI|nr:response regulator [Arcticibacter tournemirensis]TQM51011.1 signal transduction histidine kinase [Arcticibacter tournemirensis]